MKLETILSLSEDSIAKQIQALEEAGFYLHTKGFKSKAPRIHHRTRAAARRKSRAASIEVRRAYEVRKQSTLKGKWRHMRRSIRKQTGDDRFMSFEEWTLLWRKAGAIKLGDGSTCLAWKARGRSKGGGWGTNPEKPQLRRWELDQPYTLNNVYVQYRQQVLADGAELADFLASE